ncbi:MAG: hypothetical protein SGI72_17270 [Planctomycetota bacterium]|nr:hypothetical protein [Planctomycetota bacterium]
MNLRPLSALFLLAAALVITPSANAQELGIQFKKKHVSFGLTIGNAHAPRHYDARPIGYERREWIPSHYETVSEQVFVPGREERVFVPARYEWRHDSCGRPFQVLACAAHYETRCTPGHYATVTRRVWVEGGWRMRHCN